MSSGGEEVRITVRFERADGTSGMVSMAEADRAPETVRGVLDTLPRGAVVDFGGVDIEPIDENDNRDDIQ